MIDVSMKPRRFVRLAIVGVAIAIASEGRSAVIIRPTEATTTTTSTDGAYQGPHRLVDNSGFVAYDTAAPPVQLNQGDPIPATTQAFPQVRWGSFSGFIGDTEVRYPRNLAPVTFNLKLDAVYSISSFYMWNYIETFLNDNNSYNKRGTKDFTLAFSADGVNYSAPLALQAAVGAGDVPFTNVDVEQFAIPAVNAGFVRLQIQTNHGDPNFIGLNEVRFGGDFVSALPDPPDADFNDDESVDGADFTIWAGSFGAAATPTTGDANGDARADGADFLIWQRTFGAAPAAVATPEPSCLALTLAALLAWGRLPRNFKRFAPTRRHCYSGEHGLRR